MDSSVWVSFLQQGGDPFLARLLMAQQVAMHDMVRGEVSMGSARQRQTALELLPELPALPVAAHAEVMLLVDQHRLYGKGVGYVDAHLLTAVMLVPGILLWTKDKRLHAAAEQLGIAFVPSLY